MPGPHEHGDRVEQRRREQDEHDRERREVLAEDDLAVAHRHRDEKLERAGALLGGERRAS